MSTFQFKHFSIRQTNAAMKVGTDAMLLGSIMDFPARSTLLDIGTGTGVLSLIAAQRFHPNRVVAVELDKEAGLDARHNFEQAPFPCRPEIVIGDVTVFQPGYQFDGIFSNPPFFDDSSKSPNAERTTARHTDTLSDTALLQSVRRLLTASGTFWVIIPFEKTKRFISEAKAYHLLLQDNVMIEGKPGRAARSVLAFGFSRSPAIERTLTVRKADGSYTGEYVLLTKELHDRDLNH